jgi:RNA 2',3'-cyclic 3'-phosphodiesterase
MRLFVGIRVSVATANALAGCAETLARRSKDAGVAIKWVAPVNYHVTLKFLGFTRDDAVRSVEDALTAAALGVTGWKIKVARLGAFESFDRATVLWAGIEDPAPLIALAARIDSATAALGFAIDSRPFHPHVTLGRLRETRALKDVVLPMSEQMFGDTRVDAITLLESETKSSGSVYREIARIPFKTASSGPETTFERQTGALETADETDDGWPRGHGQ